MDKIEKINKTDQFRDDKKQNNQVKILEPYNFDCAFHRSLEKIRRDSRIKSALSEISAKEIILWPNGVSSELFKDLDTK